jgi:hypothetical protein
MKIYFAVVGHRSEKFRPQGTECVNLFIDSLYKSYKEDFNLVFVDNQSEPSFEKEDVLQNRDNLKYVFVENQLEKGLTGAWNLSKNQSIEDGADIVILCNDDLYFDESIKNLVSHIQNDTEANSSIYSTVSNGTNVFVQKAHQPNGLITELEGRNWDNGQLLGGFLYAFNKEFYHKFKNDNGDLFAIKHKYDCGDGKWGGQEGELIRMKEQGAKIMVVGTAWVGHHKLTSYRGARDYDWEVNGK